MKHFKSLEPLIQGIERLKQRTGETLTADEEKTLNECIGILRELERRGCKRCQEEDELKVWEVISKLIEIAGLLEFIRDAGIL